MLKKWKELKLLHKGLIIGAVLFIAIAIIGSAISGGDKVETVTEKPKETVKKEKVEPKVEPVAPAPAPAPVDLDGRFIYVSSTVCGEAATIASGSATCMGEVSEMCGIAAETATTEAEVMAAATSIADGYQSDFQSHVNRTVTLVKKLEATNPVSPALQEIKQDMLVAFDCSKRAYENSVQAMICLRNGDFDGSANHMGTVTDLANQATDVFAGIPAKLDAAR